MRRLSILTFMICACWGSWAAIARGGSSAELQAVAHVAAVLGLPEVRTIGVATPPATAPTGDPLQALTEVAEHVGLHTRLIKADLNDLHKLTTPAIALLWSARYATVDEINPMKFRVREYGDSPHDVAEADFAKEYAGLALLCARDERELPSAAVRELDLRLGWYRRDFGEIPQGQTTSTTLDLHNNGKQSLIISSVRGTCGCSPVTLPQHTIPPGGTVTATLAFHSAGRAGDQALKFYIVSNDPVTPVAEVVYSGRVLAPPAPLKRQEEFGTVTASTPAFKRIELGDEDGHPLTVISAISDSPVFTVTPVQSARDGQPNAVLIAIAADAPVGSRQGTITIRTNSTTRPNVLVAVSAVIQPKQSPKAIQFFFGEVKQGAPVSKTATLALPDHRPFTVKPLGQLPAHVTATIAPASSGNAYLLTVTLGTDMPVGILASRFEVVLDGADAPHIPVEMYGKVVP